MVDKYPLDLTNAANRRSFLTHLATAVDQKGYPTCDVDLIYDLVDATFIRDEAETRGYREFSNEIHEYVDEVFEPLDTQHRQDIESYTKEEASILETSQLFQESLGTFTQEDGNVVHGGNIANKFITAEDRDKVHDYLKEFEEWYQADIEEVRRAATKENDVIEGPINTYTFDEFEKVALYNGLRRLLYRRETGEEFTRQETAVP